MTNSNTDIQRKAPYEIKLAEAEEVFLTLADLNTVKKEMGYALQLIRGNELLQKCTPESIKDAVLNVARTGITLNPILKLAYLVPRKGKCVLDFDYKGLIKVLKDQGAVKDIRGYIVYEDEEFIESTNPIQGHHHVISRAETEADQQKRKVKGVYSVAVLPDNTVITTELMPYWQVLKVEKTSQSASSTYSPWKNWRESMIIKTKIRSDFKFLMNDNIKNNEAIQKVIEIEDANNGPDSTGFNTLNKPKKKSINDIYAEEVPYSMTDEEGELSPEENTKDLEATIAEYEALWGVEGKRTAVNIKVLQGLIDKAPNKIKTDTFSSLGVKEYSNGKEFLEKATVEELYLVLNKIKAIN